MQNKKWYFTASAIIFTIIGIGHLGRIILSLPVYVAEYEIPLWVSGAAVLIAGYLATRGFMEAHKL